MRKTFYLLVNLLLIGALWGCTYHNEDDYFKDNPNICYTEERSYTEHIQPILEANCISCHNSTDLTADVDLSAFETVQSLAESGKLLGVISHADGFVSMPPYDNQLSDCAITQIEAWINQGMLNN